MTNFPLRLGLLLSLACISSTVSVAQELKRDVDFDLDIKPLLSDRCYVCHGPDAAQRSTDLRLDTREGLFAAIDGVFAEQTITPGDPAASELFARITSDDEDLVMPPPDSNLHLTAEEVALIRTWIQQGAPWKGHWSFEPIQSQTIPPPLADQTAAVESPIDRFIDRRLQSEGLQRTTPATPQRLIRRLYYDLTGLPPTAAQLEHWLKRWGNSQPEQADAYERLVDHLFASPDLGERLATEWLDAARYSDTYGYQVDRDRRVWPWRNWVLDAINQNMPYDQFLTEQIAGDLLPGASDDQILATTFNRLHPQKVEGGSVPEEFRIEYVADRTQTFSTAVLGLTMECARCHDHKYDPLSQRNYYELSAFFDNIDEAGLYSFFTPSVPTPTLSLFSDAQKQQIEALRKEIAELESETAELSKTQEPQFQKWIGTQSPTDIPGQVKHLDFEKKEADESVPGVVGNAVKLTGDDEVKLDVGNFRRFQPFSFSLWMNSPKAFERAVVFHRSRAWTDAASRGYELLVIEGRLQFSLIHFWPGNAISVQTVEPIAIDKWQAVSITYDGSSRADGIQIFIDGKPMATSVVRDQLTRQITGGGNDNVIIGARFRDRGFKQGLVDEFRVFDRELSHAEALQLATVNAAEKPLEVDDSQLRSRYLLSVDPAMAEHRQRLMQAREKLAAIQDAAEEIMVMRELPQQRPTHLLSRGLYDAPAELVSAATPEALSVFDSQWPRNRLGLAQWVTDPTNPLTARVAVNRHWQMLFGEGLVRTPEDFGTQGARPTHPELLDWLASDFIANGWDVKRLLKQIVMSATYRQSSECSEQTRRIDPENKLLARAPRFRLSAEMLRDGYLQASGLLDQTLGGPSVNPYEVSESFKPKPFDAGSGLYRRSVYTYWKRTGPPPAMMTFDASKRDVCQLRRERTSSPLQSFVLMNGPQFVEAARFLAMNVALQQSDDTARIDAVFQRLTQRKPTPREAELVLSLLQQETDKFEQDVAAAEALLNVGSSREVADLSRPRWAALTVVVSTLMNFDPAVMRR
ncbi:DUF1553 domain-containing protein [Rosistilla oblonga]|uniref:Planctomycete cytochrome C n=1 Tax=Rosistilla oblonga TaxID=2527990 RepID=A0A518J222_9BACT|nr:DUF1553 domain-containing protein [Rosistilla oblonga]QDV59378.1 Planctomycete cytochrome C [Rosistilla oblonga]